ncbi:MAG: HNH endonuclease [Bacteroidia bacterium]
MAISKLIIEKEKVKDYFISFTIIRQKFENYLTSNKILINQIIRKYGSNKRSLPHLKDFYDNVIRLLLDKKNDQEILDFFKKEKKWDFLNPAETELTRTTGKEFSDSVKSSKVIQEENKNHKKCEICGCLIHSVVLTHDHILEKNSGGDGNLENDQLAHPFCNTGYKNWVKHYIERDEKE